MAQKRFASGKYTLKNPQKYLGSKAPMYRSGWEFSFMRFCDEHPNVDNWSSEAIRIPYLNPLTGKRTTYVPDFLVSYLDRNNKKHVELIEVKPKNQTIKENAKSNYNKAHWVQNQAKWTAARAWCKQRGIHFRIVTEDDIYHRPGGR